MGRRAHPDATALFITADAGGSNGYRARAWKLELQQFADESHLRVRVSHFPPGPASGTRSSIRLFCHITENWRGKPSRPLRPSWDLIGHTRTAAGLRVKAKLDTRTYPTGVPVSRAQMDTIALYLTRSMVSGTTNCYPDEVGNFNSIKS